VLQDAGVVAQPLLLASQAGSGQVDPISQASTFPQATLQAQDAEQSTNFLQLAWPQVTSQLPVPQVTFSAQLETLEQSTRHAALALQRMSLLQEFCPQVMSQAAP
jgi:hypothetical protein